MSLRGLIFFLACFFYQPMCLAAQPYSLFYNKLPTPQDTGLSSEQVQVLAFFSYQCASCQAFKSALDGWMETQPDTVVFQWVASPKGIHAKALSQAYYASLNLQQESVIGPLFYDTIANNNVIFRDTESVASFMAKHLDRSVFEMESALETLSVRSAELYAQQLTAQYNIVHLPALIVNGKYIIHQRLAPNAQDMLDTLHHLVQKELK